MFNMTPSKMPVKILGTILRKLEGKRVRSICRTMPGTYMVEYGLVTCYFIFDADQNLRDVQFD